VAEGALIATHHTTLHVLGPPVEGANWLEADGPSNDQDNHHRRGIFIFDGRAVISRRYAIDWKQIKNGAIRPRNGCVKFPARKHADAARADGLLDNLF